MENGINPGVDGFNLRWNPKTEHERQDDIKIRTKLPLLIFFCEISAISQNRTSLRLDIYYS
jgi:hypothetical protein